MTAELLQRLQVWRQSTFSVQSVTSVTSDHHLRQTAAQHCILGSLVVVLSEERKMLAVGQLQVLRSTPNIHFQLGQVLQNLRAQGLPVPQGWLQPAIVLEDAVLSTLLTCFDVLPNHFPTPVSCLGQIYESFLESSSAANQIRKSTGVYYTPQSIADYIVGETVGAIVPHRLPRVLDLACGSGIFLQTAYQYLLDWHLQSYLVSDQERLIEIEGQLCLPIAERQRLLAAIYGVDIDPQAVAITQISLLLKLMESPAIPAIDPYSNLSTVPTLLPDLSRNIRPGNALIGSDFYTQSSLKHQISNALQTGSDWKASFDWDRSFPDVLPAGGFDVVIGNPPYIDAETMTRCCPDWRSYCTQRYRTASGNWDIFCLFIEKALERCKDQGLTSMIVPSQLVSANYASVARSILSCENQLLSIRDYSQVAVFPMAVYPLVYVTQKGLPNLEQTVRYEVMATIDRPTDASRHLDYAHFQSNQYPWSLSLHTQQLNVTARLRRFPVLAHVAQVSGSATVAEAYALQALIQEKPEIETGDLRLVNSGTIDRYRICWGEKRLRYLGATFLHPVIPHSLMAQLSHRRQGQAGQPKLIVAGMTKRLECAVDLSGAILAGKSTCIILTSMDLRYLLGLLNSRLVNLYFTHSFSGNRLQGGYLRVGPPQLKQIPIPILDQGNVGDRHLHDHLISLVDQLLIAQQTTSPASNQQQATNQHILELEQQIDRLVYEIYRLTDEEIEAITG
jgi:hypothetical protein